MATRQESIDLYSNWFNEIRNRVNKLQGMLEPIQNGWAYKTSFGNEIVLTPEQRQTHLNNGALVIQELQIMASQPPDASGFLE